MEKRELTVLGILEQFFQDGESDGESFGILELLKKKRESQIEGQFNVAMLKYLYLIVSYRFL